MKFADGVEILGDITPAYSEILTPEAMRFLASTGAALRSHAGRAPGGAREEAGGDRRRRAARFPARDRARSARADWTVAPIPHDLLDRRVEITGPVDRKMVINALNSGANVFMADFEDSNSPTWQNNIEGQLNLRDAVSGDDQLHQSGRQAATS